MFAKNQMCRLNRLMFAKNEKTKTSGGEASDFYVSVTPSRRRESQGAEGCVGRSFDVLTAHFMIMDLWVYTYIVYICGIYTIII